MHPVAVPVAVGHQMPAATLRETHPTRAAMSLSAVHQCHQTR
jgi:hypothetical protein